MTKKNATDRQSETGSVGEWESGQEGLVTARHFGTWQFPARAYDKNVKFAERGRVTEGVAADGRRACHS